jgi:ribosome production factor 2
MLELYINPDTFRQLNQFKNKKPAIGLKPMLSFHGTVFESPTETKYTLAKSLLLDFFRGQETNEVDVAGLQYMISVSAEEEVEGESAPKIHLRGYLIKTKRSGQKLPRVEVEEMGPRFDFTVGRERFADPDMLKDALKKPKGTEARTKKNIDMDIMGDKIGKIHPGKQDFNNLQTRKMKGLKRSRDEKEGEKVDDAATAVGEDEGSDGGVELPTSKKAKA